MDKYFRKILIFSDILSKRLFQSDLKKLNFCRNIDIYGLLDKKPFFQSDLKNSTFPWTVCFQRYGQKNDVFKVALKKPSLSWNVATHIDMGYSELGSHSKILTCCGGTWKYKSWETQV